MSKGEPLIKFTYSSNSARVRLLIAWTRVHAISAVPPASDARRVATSPAIINFVWEHSPTRIKRRERMRLNRGEDSPINYPNISSLLRDTWRPTRAPTRPRGLSAIWRGPCAFCVGHTRPATWPQCHVVTARWSRAPRQPPPGFACHVISRVPVDQNTPLFLKFK